MLKKLWWLPLLFTTIYLGWFFYLSADLYLSKYDGAMWWQRYQQSQYARGEKSDYILSDAEFNAVKGYRLIHDKVDPSSFPAGHPPLSTYFLGLSTELFGNPYVLSAVFGIFCLTIFFFLIKHFTNSRWISSLVTLVFATEPLFSSQINDSMLDIFQLFFLLSALYCYFLWLQNKKTSLLVLSQLSVGFVLSSKFFLGGLPLMIALFLATVATGNFKLFVRHTLSLVAIFVGFALGHLSYFFYHPSLIEFLKYQRYLLSWWAGSPQVPPFQVWDLIFNNRWHTWWGNEEILSALEWRITWPVLIIMSLIQPIVLVAKKKIRKLFEPKYLSIYLWLGAAFLIFSFSAVYPRHLLLVLPGLYLLASSNLTLIKNKK